VSAESPSKSPLTPQKNNKKNLKNGPPGGQRGAGSNFFLPKFLLFFFRSPCKIWEPYDNPFWKNSDGGREKEEEKKSMIIVVPSCLKDADGAYTRSDQNGNNWYFQGCP
jgi:hypothetical protein